MSGVTSAMKYSICSTLVVLTVLVAIYLSTLCMLMVTKSCTDMPKFPGSINVNI